MITLLIIEIGIVVIVAVAIGADMANNRHPSLRD